MIPQFSFINSDQGGTGQQIKESSMPGVKIRKLNGATLMEVLVAITIIMTVISISVVVFVNVTGSSFTGEKVKSILFLNEVSLETQKNKSFFDEELTKGNILIVKKVEKYNGNKDLYLMHLSAYNGSKKLLHERKEILVIENE